MTLARVGWLVVLLAGCRGTLQVRAQGAGNVVQVGVGSQFEASFRASLEGCGHGYDGLVCLPLALGPMVMGDFTVDDPRRVSIERVDRSEHGVVRVLLRARAAGRTVLRAQAVSGSGHSHAEVTIDAVLVDGVKVTVLDPCAGQQGPWLLSPGTAVRTQVRAFHRGVGVQGTDYEPRLIDVSDGPFRALWENGATVTFQAGPTGGTSVVTSGYDPTLRQTLTSFLPDEVDQGQLTFTSDGCAAATVARSFSVRGQKVCAAAATLRVETPAVCSFSETREELEGHGGRVFGRTAGRCVVALGLVGSSRVDRAEVTFGQCTRWQLEAPGNDLSSLGGTAPDDLWAVGPEQLLHFDGRAWARPALPVLTGDPRAPVRLGRVLAFSATDVWLTTSGDQLLHFDGRGWAVEALPRELGQGAATLAGAASTDLWLARDTVLSHRGADLRWRVVAALESPPGGLVSERPGVVVGSSRRGVFRHDGARLELLGGPSGRVWRDPSGGLWADANGAVSHFEGGAWVRTLTGATTVPTGFCGSGPRDVYELMGASPPLHFDGVHWLPLPVPPEDVQACWAPDAQHVYAVGSRGVLRLRR